MLSKISILFSKFFTNLAKQAFTCFFFKFQRLSSNFLGDFSANKNTKMSFLKRNDFVETSALSSKGKQILISVNFSDTLRQIL